MNITVLDSVRDKNKNYYSQNRSSDHGFKGQSGNPGNNGSPGEKGEGGPAGMKGG